MPSQCSILFTPLKVGNVTLKNRICISPMSQYQCVDGLVNDWHLVHYGARAIGGAALVMLESTAVEERGRITAHCPGIWKTEQIDGLRRIADFIKRQNSIPAIQLSHAGRKASTYPPFVVMTEHLHGQHLPKDKGGWDTVGPSPIAFDPQNDPLPKEATLEDIASIKQSFVDGAKRALEAGFQVIELHFAYGCLVASFLSPFSNHRTDEYGGSFEGRVRLALELVREVKSALPDDFPLFVRLCCSDNLPEGDDFGWNLTQSIELCKRFQQLGVHLVDCSSGGNDGRAAPTFVDQISMAECIHRECDIPTGASGGIVSPRWAEQVLRQNKASLVFIGRASLDDASWPKHAADQLNASLELNSSYSWAIGEEWRRFNGLLHLNDGDLNHNAGDCTA